jgi:mannitol-1-/sugar-/sorbitol-6-/2-deoxyglucose-6-phosphatase
VMDEVMALVLARLEARLPVLPGALEAVRLAATRYPVALASGSPIPIIKRVMELTGLDKVFQAMVYGDDQPRGKPHPDVYLETARLLGVSPERCVGIEDSINGIRSLHAAGMKIIAVPSPSFPLPDEIRALADVQLESLEDFSVTLLDALDD